MREHDLKEQLDKVVDKILAYRPEKRRKVKAGKKVERAKTERTK